MPQTKKEAEVMEKEDKLNIVEEEFTKEETMNHMKVFEGDMIEGLIAAAVYREEEQQTVEIIRAGKPFFVFHIRPMGEDEYNQCRKKYTKYVRNKQLGIKLPEDTDNVKYRCSLIYHATTEEDRAKLWDNKQVWNALSSRGHQIVTALDVIEVSLLGGEKDKVIDAIDKLSGFDNNQLEEVVKN